MIIKEVSELICISLDAICEYIQLAIKSECTKPEILNTLLK